LPLWLDNRDVQRRNEVSGAWGKKQVWRPMFEPEVFRKQMYRIEESAYDIAVTFWSPAVIRRQEKCAVATPRYVSGVIQ